MAFSVCCPSDICVSMPGISATTKAPEASRTTLGIVRDKGRIKLAHLRPVFPAPFNGRDPRRSDSKLRNADSLCKLPRCCADLPDSSGNLAACVSRLS